MGTIRILLAAALAALLLSPAATARADAPVAPGSLPTAVGTAPAGSESPAEPDKATAEKAATLLAPPLAKAKGGFTAAIVINNAPIAVDDTYSVVQDNLLTVAAPGVIGNDSDPDGDAIAVTSFSGGGHVASLGINGDGSLSYEPQASFFGTDTVHYTLEDSHGATAIGTLTITVTESLAPVAVDDYYLVDAGVTRDVAAPGFMANDYDPDGDQFTPIDYTYTSHGFLYIYNSGALVYTPDAGFTGTDTMTYRLVDEHGKESGVATVTFAVGSNHNPIAVDDHYTVVEGETLNVNAADGILANDTDPDSDPVHIGNVGEFSHASSQGFLKSGGLYYTPAAGFTGDDTVTYQAYDPYGAPSANTTVTITVTPKPNAAPVGVDDHYSVVAGGTLTIPAPGYLANDTDPDGDPVLGQLIGGFDHGGLDFSIGGDGHVTFTPEAGFLGEAKASYKIADDHGNLAASFAHIYVTVLPAPVTLAIVDDEYAVGQGETLTVNAPGVLGNDTVPAGSSLGPCTDAAHGTATCHADGSFTFKPDAGFSGDATFVYAVNGPVAPASVRAAALEPNQGLVTIHVTADETATPTDPTDPADPTPSDDHATLPDTGGLPPSLPALGGMLILGGLLMLRRARRA